MNLSEINKKNHKLCKCSLKKISNPVFGSGNEKSRIVFIGEAPGKEEDAQGTPFVGRAGKFLDTLFEQSGIQRKNIYITNTVKYRPPENRDPTKQEKQDCLVWLLEELSYIKPIIIATLGTHALSTFISSAFQLKDIHGTPQKLPEYIVVGDVKYKLPQAILLPLYHPASALYNPKLKTKLVKDMKNLPIIISRKNKVK